MAGGSTTPPHGPGDRLVRARTGTRCGAVTWWCSRRRTVVRGAGSSCTGSSVWAGTGRVPRRRRHGPAGHRQRQAAGRTVRQGRVCGRSAYRASRRPGARGRLFLLGDHRRRRGTPVASPTATAARCPWGRCGAGRRRTGRAWCCSRWARCPVRCWWSWGVLRARGAGRAAAAGPHRAVARALVGHRTTGTAKGPPGDRRALVPCWAQCSVPCGAGPPGVASGSAPRAASVSL